MTSEGAAGDVSASAVQALLEQCLDAWEDQGATALEALCREHPQHAAALRQRVDALRALGLLTDNDEARLPERIGHYRVTRLIGRGGMGVVFEAEQDQPQRKVAVKVLRTGVDGLGPRARFAQEAELLARLQHPGIAQIHEAGSANLFGETLPFFAMELVQGEPLDSYADRQGLAVPARLELLAKVADAVQHAHEKGVVHRDLKPSNILVDARGQPKVLDFGVARTTQTSLRATLRTKLGQIVGTLAYMSPEQALGDPRAIDTRSDVYALGVIAYELLGRRPPYDVAGLSISDALLVIAERPPRPLGQLDKSLRGDVETIVGTALAKEKERRYASAAAFAADLRRCLAHEPITARAPTALYTLRKFARRNRGLVFGALAVVLALVLGLLGTLWGLRDAQRAQAQAQRRRAQAESAVQFQRRMLGAAQPLAEGRDARVLDVVERAARALDDEAPADAEVEATLRLTLGDTYAAIGEHQQSRAQLQRAVEALASAADAPPTELGLARAQLAAQCLDVGDLDAAERELAAARAAWAKAPADEPRRAELELRLEFQAARALRARGQFEPAIRAHQALLDRLRREASADADLRDAVVASLATTQRLAGHGDQAIATLTAHHAELLQRHGEHSARTLLARAQTAMALHAAGRVRDCEAEIQAILPRMREVFGPHNADTLGLTSTLGINALATGEFARARDIYRELIATAKVRHPAHSPLMVAAHNNLASALAGTGEFDEGERLLRALIDDLTRHHGGEHPDTLTVKNGLAVLLQRAKRRAQALPLLEEVLAARQRTLGADHPNTLRSMRNLAVVLTALNRAAEAEPLLHDAVARAKAALGEGDFLTGELLLSLGFTQRDLDKLDDAERSMLAAHAWLERTLGPTSPRARDVAKELSALYQQRGNRDAAEQWALRTKPQ